MFQKSCKSLTPLIFLLNINTFEFELLKKFEINGKKIVIHQYLFLFVIVFEELSKCIK